jgi:hypothetical protein
MIFQKTAILQPPELVSFDVPEKSRHGTPYNLRQIQGIIADCVEDEVLEFVDYMEKILAQVGHGECLIA